MDTSQTYGPIRETTSVANNWVQNSRRCRYAHITGMLKNNLITEHHPKPTRKVNIVIGRHIIIFRLYNLISMKLRRMVSYWVRSEPCSGTTWLKDGSEAKAKTVGECYENLR